LAFPACPDTVRLKPSDIGNHSHTKVDLKMAELIEHKILENLERPKRVIILLHGIGQHAGYMAAAGRAFSDKMPGTLIVMPEAPIRMKYSAEKVARVREKYDPGFDPAKARSWFRTETYTWPAMSLKLAFNKLAVVHQVNRLADHYRDQYGLEDKDIAFFGMSQGGAIALYAAIARVKACAGVVCHSGMFFGFARAQSKPDALMITGRNDDYLCDNKSWMKSFFVAPDNSLRRLKRRGIPVTETWLPGLGHEMTDESIAKAADFISSAFKAPANDAAPRRPESRPAEMA
jgi:phospholipase/carboxylesterase